MILKKLRMRKYSLLLVCALFFSLHSYASHTEDEETLNLLSSVKDAAKKMSYSGTFVYQQGNQIRTSKITHGYDGRTEVGKLEILDGNPREYIRKNGSVSSYLPDSKVIQVEKSYSHEEFPSILNSNVKLLQNTYSIKKLNMSKVAGHECQVVSLQGKDDYRYNYRLCIDKKTGLLLGAQTVNSNKDVIEQIAFTQISIGDVDRTALQPSYAHTKEWKVENLTVKANVNSGWKVAFLPSGFKKTLETKRIIPISNNDVNTNKLNVKSHQVVQMMFSDGLSSISVFVETNLGNRTEGSLQQGAMTIMGKRQGNYWLTVVGEVPQEAIKQVMESIQFQK